MYILRDGTEVNAQQIEDAFKNGIAVLIHGNAENHTSTSLMLDGKHFDTRGECYSVWEESWTTKPNKLDDCLRAAFAGEKRTPRELKSRTYIADSTLRDL